MQINDLGFIRFCKIKPNHTTSLKLQTNDNGFRAVHNFTDEFVPRRLIYVKIWRWFSDNRYWYCKTHAIFPLLCISNNPAHLPKPLLYIYEKHVGNSGYRQQGAHRNFAPCAWYAQHLGKPHAALQFLLKRDIGEWQWWVHLHS